MSAPASSSSTSTGSSRRSTRRWPSVQPVRGTPRAGISSATRHEIFRRGELRMAKSTRRRSARATPSIGCRIQPLSAQGGRGRGSARRAFATPSKRPAMPTSGCPRTAASIDTAIDDKKLHAELKTAAENLREASQRLRGEEQKKRRWGRLLLFAIAAAVLALVLSEGLRKSGPRHTLRRRGGVRVHLDHHRSGAGDDQHLAAGAGCRLHSGAPRGAPRDPGT